MTSRGSHSFAGVQSRLTVLTDTPSAQGTHEPRATFAWVFSGRVCNDSAEPGLDAAQMLGHVIAHELGHLLLPHGAHSLAGVVRRRGIERRRTPSSGGCSPLRRIRRRTFGSVSQLPLRPLHVLNDEGIGFRGVANRLVKRIERPAVTRVAERNREISA